MQSCLYMERLSSGNIVITESNVKMCKTEFLSDFERGLIVGAEELVSVCLKQRRF